MKCFLSTLPELFSRQLHENVVNYDDDADYAFLYSLAQTAHEEHLQGYFTNSPLPHLHY